MFELFLIISYNSGMRNILIRLIIRIIIEKMKVLSAEGETVPRVLIMHINQYLQICQCVFNLYRKNKKLTNIENELSDDMFLEQFFYPAKGNKNLLIQELISEISKVKCNFMYYQRSNLKLNYQAFYKSLIEKLLLLSKKGKKQMFSDRYSQVSFIQNVSSALQVLYSKIKQYLASLSITCPPFIHKLYELCSKKVFKIDFLSNQNKKPMMFQFKFISPQSTQGGDSLNQSFRLKFQKTQSCKNSNVRTYATTRPSMSGRRSPKQQKINKPITKQVISFTECDPINRISLTEGLNEIKSSKNLKSDEGEVTIIPRPLTALSNNQRSNHSSRNYVEESFKKSKNSLNSYKSDKSKSLNNKINEQITINQGHHTPERKRTNQKSKGQIVQSQTPTKKKIFQKVKNIDRRVRRVKHEHKYDISSLKTNFQNLVNWKKNYEKNHKLSENIHYKQLRGDGRSTAYKLENTTQASDLKKYKNNSYKKKIKILNKAIKITEIGQAYEESEIQHQDFKQEILLIKAREQKPSTQKRILIPKISARLAQKLRENQIDQSKRRNHFSHKKNTEISNTPEKNNNQSCKNGKCPVELDLVNKLREQFVYARWQNKLVASNDKQNSVFFIEQGFLSHKQNLQFQKYLKELKQIGNQPFKEPFNIENQIEDSNNQKIRELQRDFTFRVEEQWIKHHLLSNSNALDFHQKGIDSVRQFNI